MSPEKRQEDPNNRQYFRAQGYVYLRLEKLDKDKRIFSFPGEELPESLDPIELKFMNFRSRLQYQKPAQEEFFEELLMVMEAVYSEQSKKRKLPRSKKEWVHISASGLDLETDHPFEKGEKLICLMTFPDYPFESVSLLCEVIHCNPHSIRENYYLLGIAFHNVSEPSRQSLIKFVNQLQRKKTIKKTVPAD
ncbi:MAG: PilZ domain-containing protein [Deltaproteobacteria bacterium]|nr:PilZ domain-containing protein [Deltaproteobacteria bacterium]